jgi:8-amino-7-oxononanoate synthase
MSDFTSLQATLAERKANHLYRHRRVLGSAQGAQVIVDGKACINFCSNDYLGLANHPDVVAAFQAAANDYGVGSGASHLVCGHSQLHHQLEEKLAAFTGRDRALLFSTGYMANLAVISSLLGKKDFIFEDKLNHASFGSLGCCDVGVHIKRASHLG